MSAAVTRVPLRLRVGARAAVRVLRWLGAEQVSVDVHWAGRRFARSAARHAVWVGGKRVHLWSSTEAELGERVG